MNSLVQVLLEQIQLEKEVEMIKCDFKTTRSFSCIEIFKVFDILNKGYINLTDFKESLRMVIGEPNIADLYLLFKRYDKDQDGKISYAEFCAMILPRDRNAGEQLSSR